MSRKKAINLIIKDLSELSELLNVIADCREEVPGVLYKLLDEKTEDIVSQIKSLPSVNCVATEQDQTEKIRLAISEETIEIKPVFENEQKAESTESVVNHVFSNDTDLPQISPDPITVKESTVPIVEIKLDKTEDRPAQKEPETKIDEESIDIIVEPISYKAKAEIKATPVITIDKAIENMTGATIDDVIQKRLTTDIRRAISLNDRFKFKRELFNGNEPLMNSAIEALNKLNSLDEAIVYIDEQFKWNKEDETVTEFISIIEKRFS